MKMKKFVLALLACFVLAASAAAQERGNIGVYYLLKAKNGHGQQLEQGLKKHRDFHQKVGDKFVWLTWQVETGDDLGAFLVGSGGHQWKDFESQEAFGEKDGADVAMNLTPHVESVTAAFWAFMPDLSLGNEGGTPSKFLSITHYHLKPDKVADFRDAITKVNQAIRKADPAVPRRSRWYNLASGGEGPTYALVQERDSWAEFAGAGGPSLMQMVDAAYGKEGGDAVRKSFQSSYRSNRSFILRYRPDLGTPLPK